MFALRTIDSRAAFAEGVTSLSKVQTQVKSFIISSGGFVKAKSNSTLRYALPLIALEED